jgi:hypothetical protein
VVPVLLVSTATNDFLASKKFGIGPTAVALYQTRGFTIGGLINQIWSITGDATRPAANMIFVQPFFTYNWKTGAGTGNQKVQFALVPRLNLAAPDRVKSKYGVRAVLFFLFPK